MKKLLKIVVAFCLGLFSCPLLFILVFLGQWPNGILQGSGLPIVILVMCAYFFISAYLLSCDNPEPALKHWPISLALSSTFIVMPVISRAGGGGTEDVLSLGGLGILAVAVSWAGAATAARAARRRSDALANPTLQRMPGSASVPKSDISGPAPRS